MPKSTTIRFAVGCPEKPFSNVWRLVASKNDVYIGPSKRAMGVMKISLHESGVWVLAATAQSGVTFAGDNRRARRWNRPLEHADGVTRGPSIVVPYTSLGARRYKVEERKKVYWHAAPNPGEMVEFSIYFVDSGKEFVYSEDHTLIAVADLANGDGVPVLARTIAANPKFLQTCENLLRKNVFGVDDPTKISEELFLWVTESKDDLHIPYITDLPVNFRLK